MDLVQDRPLLPRHKPWKERIHHPPCSVSSALQPSWSSVVHDSLLDPFCSHSCFFCCHPQWNEPSLATLSRIALPWPSSSCSQPTLPPNPSRSSTPAPLPTEQQLLVQTLPLQEKHINPQKCCPNHCSLQKTMKTAQAHPLNSRNSSPPIWPHWRCGYYTLCFLPICAVHSESCSPWRHAPIPNPHTTQTHALTLSPFPQTSLIH